MIEDALRPALDLVEDHWRENRQLASNSGSQRQGGEGALIIVGKRDQDKFFSNGFDYESVKGNLSFFNGALSALRLIPAYHLHAHRDRKPALDSCPHFS